MAIKILSHIRNQIYEYRDAEFSRVAINRRDGERERGTSRNAIITAICTGIVITRQKFLSLGYLWPCCRKLQIENPLFIKKKVFLSSSKNSQILGWKILMEHKISIFVNSKKTQTQLFNYTRERYHREQIN